MRLRNAQVVAHPASCEDADALHLEAECERVRADITRLRARVSRETEMLEIEMSKGGPTSRFLVGVAVSVGTLFLTGSVAALCVAVVGFCYFVWIVGVAAAGVGQC